MADQNHRDAENWDGNDEPDRAEQRSHDQDAGDRQHRRQFDLALHDAGHHDVRFKDVHEHAEQQHKHDFDPVARGDHEQRRQERRNQRAEERHDGDEPREDPERQPRRHAENPKAKCCE